jgi:hypothetical protein
VPPEGNEQTAYRPERRARRGAHDYGSRRSSTAAAASSTAA